MPLILITGISTSGKSKVAEELNRRGYEAYDTERGGISAWYDKHTGKRAAGFGEMPERSEEWLSNHAWRISMDWVSQKAQEAKSRTIFICGGGENEAQVRALCDRVIWLKTDEQTIRERVVRPRDHDYGSRPHELARIFTGNRTKEVEYAALGAFLVDATRPIENVVYDIITIAESGPPQ